MTFPTAPVDVCAPTEWLPCGPYVTPDDACAPCERIDFGNPSDLALWEQNAWYATRRVFLATGAKFTNCCEMTFHPCQQQCGTSIYQHGLPVGTGPYAEAISAPVPVQGGWINVWACSCGSAVDDCMCHDYAYLPLPFAPARSITEIVIGGVVLNPAVYMLPDFQPYIIRTDGQEWPRCNSWDDPSVEWTVTYRFGYDIPPEAKPLIAAYTCELTKLCKRQKCDLPVDQYRVHGDQIFAVDIEGYRKQLLTGYFPLDDWIIQIRNGQTIRKPIATSYNMGRKGAGY